MKLYLHIIWFLLLSVLLPAHVRGQLPDYSVRKFSPEHGLQYGIKKVVQDTHGFIWLMCTLNLQRFDGKIQRTILRVTGYIRYLLIPAEMSGRLLKKGFSGLTGKTTGFWK